MSNIYGIAVKLTYDKCEYRLFRGYKFVKQEVKYYWQTPIYAINEQQAIEKFSDRYEINNCNPWIFGGTAAENIQREVVCVNENKVYSIKELQKEMDSRDFLDYCRDKLGLSQAMDTILK